MTYTRRFHQVIVCALVVLLTAACAPASPTAAPLPPTPTPVPPTATAVPPTPTAVPVEVWDYVSLGSMSADSTFPDLYAADMEADLGVKVKVQNLGDRVETEGTLLWKLQKDQELRAKVSEAEVVTLWTAAKDVHFGLTWPLIDCQEKVQALQETLGPITAEILALRGGQKTIVRLFEYYNWVDLMRDKGLWEKKHPCFEAINELVHQVGAQYGVPVVPVAEAFNGPGGDHDPGEKGYIDDLGFFLSPKGDAAVAELLRGLGYEFTIP